MDIQKFTIGLVSAFLFLTACRNSQHNPEQSTNSEDSIASEETDWQLLIADNSTSGWHDYLGDTVKGWEVTDGVLFTVGGGSDIVTDQEYDNFELSLEWKIEKAGNSGVFYHVVESPAHKRMYETGPEFQIIDNEGYPAELTEEQKTGALSDVLAPESLASNQIGMWNVTRIRVDNGAVEHWLNETKILEYKLGSDSLNQLIASSKFASLPYAKTRKGRIGLQDHGSPVYFRNIKIRPL